MLPFAANGDDESPLLLKSRELTAEYATLLQAKLQEAMSTGGPVAAITVCKDYAPEIASELSERSGATVSRTSLQLRNPDNAPESWQRDVLLVFDQGISEEFFFPRRFAEETLYMKAIPTGPVCLVCHGESLAPEIQEALDAEYPDDQARGYKLGDIRGAFAITWPVAEKQQ